MVIQTSAVRLNELESDHFGVTQPAPRTLRMMSFPNFRRIE